MTALSEICFSFLVEPCDVEFNKGRSMYQQPTFSQTVLNSVRSTKLVEDFTLYLARSMVHPSRRSCVHFDALHCDFLDALLDRDAGG